MTPLALKRSHISSTKVNNPSYRCLHHSLASLLIAEIEVVVVSTDKLKLLISQAKECPSLKIVISVSDSIPDDMAAMAKEANIKLMTYGAVMVCYVYFTSNKGLDCPRISKPLAIKLAHIN